MNSYADFAYIYDMLTEDVEYKKRTEYVEKLFLKYSDKTPSLIADIGCGTGTVCNILADKGYDMIGIDSSDSMLNVAREKSIEKDILYLLQDMTGFELYGTVDVCLSMLDSVNYLIGNDDFEKFILLVKNYLNPGGVLIFDINTPYKFKNVFANNIYTYENEKIFYTWENSFDGELCEFYLNFFVENNDGTYSRITEQHYEKCYEIEWLISKIESAGMKVEGVFGDMTEKMYKNTDERVYFIVKKY